MGFDLHTIAMPSGAGPQKLDRLDLGSYLNIPFPASAAGMGTTGAVTAGSAYTFTPTITVAGGTLTAASAAGVAPVVAAGAQAQVHAVMKVVSASVPAGGGGTGVVTNDTFLFANGIELTATASAGVVTSWAVTTAGSISDPGPLPATLVPISTSGVGVGVVAGLSWGIGSVAIDDSGSYSSFTGTTFTVASVDGNGTSGAVAGPGVAVAAGAALFKKVMPVGGSLPYGVVAMASGLNVASVGAKYTGFCVVQIHGIEEAGAAASVTAGTLDALVWS